ncbi:MAG: hypothetical protein JST00_21150 [Deltaproteobacteria bacterium]|nr:hypothetical protein [Deltaproteobacteria bacterium]
MSRTRPGTPGLPSIAREEIELRSTTRDARLDPGATAKISLEQLEEVLARSSNGLQDATHAATTETRTESGERVAVRPTYDDRSTPRSLPIVEAADAPSLPEVAEAAAPVTRAPVSYPAPPPLEEPAPRGVEASSPKPSFDLEIDEDFRPRSRRTKVLVVLAIVTCILAVGAWFAGRVFAPIVAP